MTEIMIARPDCIDDVVQALGDSTTRGKSLHVRGHTPFDGETSLTENDVLLSIEHMNRICQYDPGDLTITAEAGVTPAQLEATLARQGQRLAVEVAFPELQTLGGILGSQEEGFIQAALGPLREQVLGMTLVLGTGDVVRVGGRVVKNVTGYDFSRILCGSRGGLAIICEVTLRVHPMQEQTRSIIVRRQTAAAACQAALLLRDAPCTLSGLSLASGAAVQSDRSDHLIAVRMEGRAAVLEAAAQWMTEKVEGCEAISFEEQADLWAGLTRYPYEQPFAARAHTRPSAVLNILEALKKRSDVGIIADVHSGATTVSGPWDDQDEGVRDLTLQAIAQKENAVIEVLSDDDEARHRFSRFPPGSDLEKSLIRSVKLAFDPTSQLCRGRWFVESATP